MEGMVWIVEWDIPSDSAAKRVRFYRALKKLWVASQGEKEMSTQSVLVTDNPELAGEVFNLAKAFGTCHIYEARQIE